MSINNKKSNSIFKPLPYDPMGKEEKPIGVQRNNTGYESITTKTEWQGYGGSLYYPLYLGTCLKFIKRKLNFKIGGKLHIRTKGGTMSLGWRGWIHYHLPQQYGDLRASLVAQLVNNRPAKWETWVQSLGWEDPLEKGKAIHSSILAWRIPWMYPWGRKQTDTTEQLSLFSSL